MEHANSHSSCSTPPPLQNFDATALTLDELENEITRLAANINAAQYRWLMLVAEFERRGGISGMGLKSLAHWLNWCCGITLGAAREQVRVARALAGLPQISAAFAIGEVSFSKVRAMTRVATPENEDYLLMISRHGTAAHLEKLVRCYRRVSRRTDENHRAIRQYEDRQVSFYYDDDGSLVLRAKLLPEQAEALVRSLEAACEDLYRQDRNVSAETPGEPDPMPTFAQRRADALALMAEHYAADAVATRSGADRCQVVVHVDEAVLENPGADGRSECEHGALAPDAARRLACDASVVREIEDEHGNPLSVGRRTRTIPPALRRALAIRDSGCTFPGCTFTRFIEAHHIKHWANGGETAAENLVSLCGHHHRLLHEGGFGLRRDRDGTVHFHDPDGRRIDRAPPPARADQPVEFSNASSGVEPDEWTVRTRWRGENMDYDLGVLALQQRDGTDKLH